jgi:hypothetical protein
MSENDYSKSIGLSVEIILNNGIKINGNIFTYVKENNLLVIVNNENKNSDLTSYYINISQISKISLSKEQKVIDTNKLMMINLNRILDNEKRNISKDMLIKKAETEPNFERGLNIYEALSKLYKCSYDGKKIMLDDIGCYIEAPFRLNNLHCDDEDNKERLTSIIAGVIKNFHKK